MYDGIYQALLLIGGAAQVLDISGDMFRVRCGNTARKLRPCRSRLRIEYGHFQSYSLLSKRYVTERRVYDDDCAGVIVFAPIDTMRKTKLKLLPPGLSLFDGFSPLENFGTWKYRNSGVLWLILD